jgi:hypothetical protein
MVITDEKTFGFHALRHSLATFLVSEEVDPKTVHAMLRHHGWKGGSWVEAIWTFAAKLLKTVVSAAGFEPATHALKGHTIQVLPTTYKLKWGCLNTCRDVYWVLNGWTSGLAPPILLSMHQRFLGTFSS